MKTVRHSLPLGVHRLLLLPAILVGLLPAVGCGLLSPRVEPTKNVKPTGLVAAGLTPLPLSTQTPVIIVVTATQLPAAPVPIGTNPPPPLPTAVPPTQPIPAQPTPTHPETLRLKMYLIAIGDNGVSGLPVGCGDSLIPVDFDTPYTQAVLRTALERLLALDDRFYGESGLYNALYQSSLAIDDLNIKNGEAIIRLVGQVRLGGECDTPRVIGQLEATALQFSTVERVSITLNGVEIHEALSLR